MGSTLVHLALCLAQGQQSECLSPCELPKQKYQRLGGLNNKYVFLTVLVLEAEVQDQDARRFSVWGRPASWL